MKIKKFRIRPRLGTVGRILKAALNVKQLPAELEESMPKESDEFVKHLSPTAFYQTWTREEFPPTIQEFLKPLGLDKSLAVSALVATIGSEPEDYLSQTLMSGETARAQLITALSDESADLAFNFLCRLLVDDAKADDCELSPPVMITDSGVLSETLRLMNAEQDGIQLGTASHLTPRFTRVGLTAWMPINKRKRLASSPKSQS